MSEEQNPAGLWCWSLIDGRTAWALTTPDTTHHGTVSTSGAAAIAGQVIDGILPALPAPVGWLATPIIDGCGRANRVLKAASDGLRTNPDLREPANALRLQARDYLAGRYGADLLARCKTSNLGIRGYDPAIVATDASQRNGLASWAFVSGGGWYSTGHTSAGNVTVAELCAHIAALRMFTAGANITVITDNMTAARAWEMLAAHPSVEEFTRRERWVPPSLVGPMLEIIDRLGDGLTVEWHRRDSHALQRHAHDLAYGVAGGGRPTGDTPRVLTSQRVRRHLSPRAKSRTVRR